MLAEARPHTLLGELTALCQTHRWIYGHLLLTEGREEKEREKIAEKEGSGRKMWIDHPLEVALVEDRITSMNDKSAVFIPTECGGKLAGAAAAGAAGGGVTGAAAGGAGAAGAAVGASSADST